MKEIDSIVSFIKTTSLQHKTDTIKQDKPEYGYFGFSVITVSTEQGKIRRYINHVESTIKKQDKTEKIVSENIFYFDTSGLIKVEESATKGERSKSFHWYFSEGKSLDKPVIDEKGTNRAEFLLQISKSILATGSKN